MKSKNAKFLTRVALSVALLSVSAMISLPFAVQFTLQIFAVYFVLFAFGGVVGIASTVVYFLIGILGLPVFSGFSGGFGKLFEPSGGYIIGFVVGSVAYFIFDTIIFRGKCRFLTTAISFLCIYLCAAAVMYILWGSNGFMQFFGIAAYFVLPYLIPDIVKLVLAWHLAKKIKRYIN